MGSYPSSFHDRNRWIQAHRDRRNSVDENVPYAHLIESELGPRGVLTDVVTLFLTNRECPWKCFMCDLWKNTLEKEVSQGAIPNQIESAFKQLQVSREDSIRARSQIKLYNSGSFFDPKAIPPSDYGAIAGLIQGFGNVIVESHPRLIGVRCQEWKERLSSPLEVAMGLETANPHALKLLNKGFLLDDFRRACERLQGQGIEIRVFLLVNGPFIRVEEQEEWLTRSVQLADSAGASAICLIPTRQDSGAMREVLLSEEMRPTSLGQLERALDFGIETSTARVFADLWDLEQFSRCDRCLDARRNRLDQMNRKQIVLTPVECSCCHGDSEQVL